MRVLFVCPFVPSPIRVRAFHWITNLAAQGHDVRLCTLVSSGADQDALAPIRRYCTTVMTTEMPAWGLVRNATRALPKREALRIAAWRHDGFGASVRAAAEGVDVAHVDSLRAAGHTPTLRHVPVVYDAGGSVSRLWAQASNAAASRADRWRARVDFARTRAYERGMFATFARVLVASPVDATYLRDLAPTADLAARLSFLPSPVDLEHFRPGTGHREADTLIFMGLMNEPTNVTTARRLVECIMPLVWRERPEVQLVLAGAAPGRVVSAFSRDPRVRVTGHVDDVRPLLARATLAVYPVTYGVGVHHGLLASMAAGVPVLASHRAVDALSAEPGRDLAVAESDQDFGVAVLSLLASASNRSFLAARGRAYVAAHHMGSALTRNLETVYRQAVRDNPR